MSMRYLIPLDDSRIGAFALVRSRASAGRSAVALVVLFLLLVAGLVFVPWQQTAYGEGQVVAYSPTERQQRVDAPVEGWLEEWFVQEGTHVQQGDPIVRIVDNDPLLLDRLRAEQEASHARLKAAERALATALRNVKRQWELFNQGLSSRKQYEDAQLKETDVMKELTAARAELARIDTRSARQGRQMVTASRSGIILRRAAGEGSVYVNVGDPLAVLVPETRSRAVELWLDGNSLPLLRVGQEVRLQFEGWPAIQFSGWPAVAIGTFPARVSVVDVADAGRAGQFRILVTPMDDSQPWPDSQLLRQGVRAHGWALLSQVPLGYELWRRFNDFPPALQPPPQPSPLEPGGSEGGKKKTKKADEGGDKKG